MSRRITIRKAESHFLPDEMWSLADNPNFQWFCRGALLVDDYEPFISLPALGLAVHTHHVLSPVSDEDYDLVDDVTVAFTVEHTREPPLWRCDFERRFRDPLKLSIAGQYNSQILRAFRSVDHLALVDASVFEYYGIDDVFAVVPNDRQFWARCRPPEDDWHWWSW